MLPEGGAEWKPIGEVPELAALLASVPPPNLAPLPSLVPRRTNALATTGMIMGILSLSLACCCYGLPFNLLAIIFSLVGLSQINRDPLNQQGKGLAIAGLILAVLSILLAVTLALLGHALSSSDLLHRLEK